MNQGHRRDEPARWSLYIRPLLLVVVVLVVATYIPDLVSPPALLESEMSQEDWIRDSAEVGWRPPIEADRLAADLLARVNDERQGRGLPGLAWHEGLAELAREWSEEMLRSGFRHSLEGFRRHPAFIGIGENIAMGHTDSGQLHVGWMESDGHRSNILGPSFTHIGVGVVCRNDGRIWATQLFGVHMNSALPNQETTLPSVEPISRPESGLRC